MTTTDDIITRIVTLAIEHECPADCFIPQYVAQDLAEERGEPPLKLKSGQKAMVQAKAQEKLNMIADCIRA